MPRAYGTYGDGRTANIFKRYKWNRHAEQYDKKKTKQEAMHEADTGGRPYVANYGDGRGWVNLSHSEYMCYLEGVTMSKELKIDRDKMLKAAEQCSDVKEVFKTLWPEEFKPKEPKFKLFDLIKNGDMKYVYLGNGEVAEKAWRTQHCTSLPSGCKSIILDVKYGNIYWTSNLKDYRKAMGYGE